VNAGSQDPDLHDGPERDGPGTGGATCAPHGERGSTPEGSPPGLVAAVVSPEGLTIAASLSVLLLAVNPLLAVLLGVLVAGTAWRLGAAEGPLRRSRYRTPLLLGLVPPGLALTLLAFAAGGSLLDPYGPLRS
jgi:hypothetical protein